MTPKQGMYIGVGASVGLILIVVIVVLVAMRGRNSIGTPTEATAPAVLKKIELNLDISKITTTPPPPAEDGGANDIYLAAVKEAAAIGDDFIVTVKSEIEPEKNPAYKSIVDKIEAAADKGLGKTELNFDSVLPLTPGSMWRVRETLYAMGQLTSKRALSKRAGKDREGAEKAARATLIFGERLFNNGAFVAYKAAGLGCVSEGLASFDAHYSERFFNDPAKHEIAKQMNADYRSSTERWNKKEFLFRDVAKISPADFWNLAEHDEDPAWRRDALMWLGVAKWTHADKGQRSAIQAYLESKASSPDALTAQRAKAAADLSREEYRAMRWEK